MKNVKYYNPNPLDKGEGKKWRKDDCVIRAFCCALGKSWTTVFQDLCDIALKKYDIPLSDAVIAEYAKQNGFKKRRNQLAIPLKDFADIFEGTYLCRVRTHLVCIKDGEIYDTWDCSKMKTRTFYELVKEE